MGTHIQNFASFTEKIKANRVVQEQSKKTATQDQYTTFFKKMLQKYDISSPAELKSDEEKKKFFDEVSAGWDKEASKPTAKGKEILNESTGEINESAFAIAGGIILAVIGLNAIRSLVNRVLVGIGKNVEVEPAKLKTLVREMSTEALSVGLNTKDASIINNWQRKVESLIDAGEIKTLGQVEEYMDSELKTEIFESKLNESESVYEATVEMDAINPEDKEFLKFLKKHNVKIIKSAVHPNGHPEITMQGKRKDLEAVLADSKFGWDDPDLAEYIKESEEITNDDEFRKYAETVLKQMHGSEYDANKAKEVINGLLSKKDGNDYGALVGMLNKG